MIEDKWFTDGYQGQILVFDGPVVAGTTTGDAEAVLGYTSTDHEGPGPAVWVPGLGADGGDGVLYGSSSGGDGTSVARFVDDPVGTISADDVTATYSVESSDDYTVGRSVGSTDLDGDGVAELLIGVADYSTGMNGGKVVLAQAETGDLALEDYPSIHSGGSTAHYAVWGYNFSMGDADDDGYEDMYVNLSPRSGWSDAGYTVGALFYGPVSSSRGTVQVTSTAIASTIWRAPHHSTTRSPTTPARSSCSSAARGKSRRPRGCAAPPRGRGGSAGATLVEAAPGTERMVCTQHRLVTVIQGGGPT